MRTKITIAVMVLVVLAYSVMLGAKGIALLRSGSVVGVLLGLAILAMPLLAVTLLGRELEFGRRCAALADVLAAGIEPWTELPIWLPPDHEYAGLHAANVERAHGAGLRCRPVEETVADTWSWLASLPGPAPLRPDLPPPGLDEARERAVLDAWHVHERR